MPNGGRWTEARLFSFIKGALRAASNRWPPKWECKKKARTKRGFYLCAGYGEQKAHEVPATIKVGKKRYNNATVDHILPVIDPAKGFESWDITIPRMFCEVEGLQVLCRACHSAKTKDERELAKQSGRKKKNGT